MKLNYQPLKTEVKTIVTQEEKIVLELTREEAECLHHLTAFISGNGKARKVTDNLYNLFFEKLGDCESYIDGKSFLGGWH